MFYYPRDTKSLASCTTTSSVLCKTLKELFSFMPHLIFEAKADAKVRLFSETPKLFRKNFIQNIKVFAFFDNTGNYTLLYYIRTPINTSRVLQNESHLSSDKSGICRAHTNTIKILKTCWGFEAFFVSLSPKKPRLQVRCSTQVARILQVSCANSCPLVVRLLFGCCPVDVR